MQNARYEYGVAFGTEALRFTANYVSPLFQRSAEIVLGLAWIVFMIWLVGMWSASNWHRDIGFFFLGQFVFVIWLDWRKIPVNLACMLFGPRVDIVIGPGWVKVGGFIRYRTFLTDQFGFIAEEHIGAAWEAENERLNPKEASKRPGVLRHTRQLVLYIEDSRIVLADIYNQPDVATGMATRLNMMKEAMGREILMG